jgi:anti-sigma factor RsiW
MQHLDEGTIHAWLDGALDAEESARVDRHAAECATCAAAVAEARGLVAGASRILGALDHVPGGVVPRAAGAS